MSDPRKGLPSASSMERIVNCPGSFLAERGCVEVASEQDDDAKSGELTHAYCANPCSETLEKLTGHQIATAEMCMEIADTQARYNGFESAKIVCEKRLWLANELLEQLCSGQPDRIYVDEANSRAMIADFKTLFGDHAEAPSNWQLRTLAVLVAEIYGVNEVVVVLIQPMVSPQFTTSIYVQDDLVRSSILLRQHLDAANELNALRRAGAWCEHCKAKGNCPEGLGYVLALTFYDRETLAPEKKSELLDRLSVAEKFVDWLKGNAKRELETNPLAIPGWTLAPGSERRKLVDGKTVRDVFNAICFTECMLCRNDQDDRSKCPACRGSGRVQIIQGDEFLSACGLKIGETETLYRKTLGLKVKEAAPRFNAALDGIVEKKVGAPTLERLKTV